MQIYLVKGYLDVAATSLADAKALYTALLNPGTPANAAIIANVTGKFEALVQSDTAEPVVVSSIDDAVGTISSWVTDAGTTVALGVGDRNAGGSATLAQIVTMAITGSTRTGNLALNTIQLATEMRARSNYCGARGVTPFTLQIRRTDLSGSETMALLQVNVSEGVLSTTPTDMAVASYLTTDEAAALYVAKADARFFVPMTFIGSAVDEQVFGYFYVEKACTILGVQIAAQTAPTGAAITVDLVDAANVEQNKIGTLAASAKNQRTIYSTSLSVSAGTELRAKIKSVGSSTPGGYLTVNLICQPA